MPNKTPAFFHFIREKDRAPDPDGLAPQLQIDDRVGIRQSKNAIQLLIYILSYYIMICVMSIDSKIRAILSEAEQKLLQLIAECATAGDLAAVDSVRTAAVRLRSICEANSIDSGLGSQKHQRKKTTRQRKTKRTVEGKKFPRFEVCNATLYRIGWSKKKKEQYEHKVPRATAQEVVAAMASLARSGSGPFTGEQVIAQANQKASIAIPSYQVYAVIGWLRSHDLIQQLGRGGYQIPSDLEKNVETLWNSSSTPNN